MKLFLLRPAEFLRREESPWEPWYDKAFGFVIRAENETRARELASQLAGDEKYELEGFDSPQSPWLREDLASCTELSPEGKEEVIMRDFASA